MAEHRGTIDCGRSCVVPPGMFLRDVDASRADAPAASDIKVCPHDECPRVFVIRKEGEGRLRVVVDAGWTIFRYHADDAPKIGEVIYNRHGDSFMVRSSVTDEKIDRCLVEAISL